LGAITLGIRARKLRIQSPDAIYHERGIRHFGGHRSESPTFRGDDGESPF
jgi:hypothetical protein